VAWCLAIDFGVTDLVTCLLFFSMGTGWSPTARTGVSFFACVFFTIDVDLFLYYVPLPVIAKGVEKAMAWIGNLCLSCSSWVKERAEVRFPHARNKSKLILGCRKDEIHLDRRLNPCRQRRSETRESMMSSAELVEELSTTTGKQLAMG
jgi:hypothetical protein